VLVKLIAGIVGHANALVADAVESSADIFSSLIVWMGLSIAARPADEDHPYGHGKAEPLAAAVVSLMLLGAAVGISILAIREIRIPHHLPSPFTLFVAAGVIIVKEILYRRVSRVGKDVGSTAVTADAWHHRADAVSSLAAFIGISIALIGGRGWEAADDWAALVAAILVAVNGVRTRSLSKMLTRSRRESNTRSWTQSRTLRTCSFTWSRSEAKESWKSQC
jgi:cation diffusion facilitator family transporter